jgi:tetratricopeptide (TPR) repeat protein
MTKILFPIKSSIYQRISNNETVDPKLRAYASSELGKLRNAMHDVLADDGLAQLVRIIEESNQLLPELHPKRAENFVTLGMAYPHVGDIDQASKHFEKAISLYNQLGDKYGVASVFRTMITMYGIQGDWARMFDVRTRGLENLPPSAIESAVYSGLYGRFGIGWIMAGRYAEAGEHSRTTLAINKKIGIVDYSGTLADLALSLAFQGRFRESRDLFTEAMALNYKLYKREDPVALNFSGMAFIREGDYQKAEDQLKTALALNKSLPPRRNPPENLQWLGLLYEIQGDLQMAEDYYNKSLRHRWVGRRYYECAALTGLARIRSARGEYTELQALLVEAEKLAELYEYNDHLASLSVTKGVLSWATNNQADVIKFFKNTMIFALRYNRFLLDELLVGRLQGTPFRSMIDCCLEHGSEGKEVLLALRDWWKTAINDIGASRLSTISPVPEGISLLEAEKLARDREPGDHLPQKTVIEQIDAALNK